MAIVTRRNERRPATAGDAGGPGGNNHRVVSAPHYTPNSPNGQVPREVLDAIKDRVDFPRLFEEVFGITLPRSPNGRGSVKVRCPRPNHLDRDPSCTVYHNRVHCFGCNWHADVINLVRERYGVGFREAVRILAAQVGYPLSSLTPEQVQAMQTQREYEDGLIRAAAFFHQHLLESEAGMEYARSRWSEEAIRAEWIGFADGSPLPDLGNEQARQVAEAVNRWAARVGGAVVYAHRRGGRVVYLSARSIREKKHYNPPGRFAGPKQPYVNSVYSSRSDEVIIVEGQACAITLAGWGFPAVALAGSSPSEDLARLLRGERDVYVIPDADGRTDVQGLVEALGPQIIVVTLPDGVADVNDWARKDGTAEALRDRLNEAPEWLEQQITEIAEMPKGRRRDREMERVFRWLKPLPPLDWERYGALVCEDLKLLSRRTFNRMLKQTEAVEIEGNRYLVREGRLCIEHRKDGGRYVEPLCNFAARVTTDITYDDGQETVRRFIVEGQLEDGTALPPALVDAGKFPDMKWITEAWGSRAIVAAGHGKRDQLREAIQRLSGEVVTKRVYTHLGWRQIDGKRCYLHAGGALGHDGVEVEPAKELTRYRLPNEPDDVRGAMEASLRLLEMAPLRLTVPLWASVWLAPVSEIVHPDFVLWLYGRTGTFKSSMAALFLSHYGGPFTAKDLPGWWSTANALEKLCYLTKDALLVIDDFAPKSNPREAREQRATVNRIIRAVGNRAGRQRLNRNLRLRKSYPPRGLVISTGEMIPGLQSVVARLYVVEVGQGDVDRERLSAAQAEAERYPHALAGYVLWLSEQWDELRQSLPRQLREIRDRLVSEVGGEHMRLPNALAMLYLGFDLGLQYAVEVGALSEEEANGWRNAGWTALTASAEAHSRQVAAESPTGLYFEALEELLAQRKVRLKSVQGGSIVGSEEGEHIGWYDDDHIYLLPRVAYKAVNDLLRGTGRDFPLDERALRKYLAEEGYLERQGERYTVLKRTPAGRRHVLKIRRERVTLLPEEGSPG